MGRVDGEYSVAQAGLTIGRAGADVNFPENPGRPVRGHRLVGVRRLRRTARGSRGHRHPDRDPADPAERAGRRTSAARGSPRTAGRCWPSGPRTTRSACPATSPWCSPRWMAARARPTCWPSWTGGRSRRPGHRTAAASTSPPTTRAAARCSAPNSARRAAARPR